MDAYQGWREWRPYLDDLRARDPEAAVAVAEAEAIIAAAFLILTAGERGRQTTE